MSDFEIVHIPNSKLNMSKVKPIDERWKNFPMCYLPQEMVKNLNEMKYLQLFDDDVLLTGYPRSGTTIVAEMLWLIVNNFDFDTATSVVTDDRIPGIELNGYSQRVRMGKTVNTFEVMSRPRVLKTHLPVQLLPDDVWVKKPKMIYVSLDPRDVSVSNYHFVSHFHNEPIASYLEKVLNDEIVFGPLREHRLNFWNIPDYPNILFLTYESITSDIDNAINKVADFLGATISDENLNKLKDHLQFDKMKTNKACNNEVFLEKLNQVMKQKTSTDDFIRRGKIGGFRDEVPNEYIEKFNNWMAKEIKLNAGFPQIRN